MFPAANTLFSVLALIDFAWSAAVMVLEKQDFHSWVSALIRKMMTIGAFYALLVFGRFWIPAIVDSFELLGQNAAATGPLDPGEVFLRGLNLSAALLDGASSSGIFANIGGSLAVVFAAVLCLLGFCAITVQFVVAMVESYILVAAGFIFLGFGGSRWSSPYVERYIGLAVAVGTKILLLYLLISAGMNVSLGWLDQAEEIPDSAFPAMGAFSIMAASLIFAAVCWHVPKLIAGVIGGSPSLAGNDLLSTAWTVSAGAALVASGASAAVSGGRSVVAAAQAGVGRFSSTNATSAAGIRGTSPTAAGTAGGRSPRPPAPASARSGASISAPAPPTRDSKEG